MRLLRCITAIALSLFAIYDLVLAYAARRSGDVAGDTHYLLTAIVDIGIVGLLAQALYGDDKP